MVGRDWPVFSWSANTLYVGSDAASFFTAGWVSWLGALGRPLEAAVW